MTDKKALIIPYYKLRWLLVFYVIFIFISPVIFSKLSLWFSFDEKSGVIGDTIGGITAPFINLLAAFLVYLSFQAQINANKELSKENNFNYISKLFELVEKRVTQVRSYTETTKISGVDAVKFQEHQIKWIVSWLESMNDALKFTQRMSVVKVLAPKEYSVEVKSKIINKRIKEPLQYLLGDLDSLNNLVEKINSSNLDEGIKSFYKTSISEMILKMDLKQMLDYTSSNEFKNDSNQLDFLDVENKNRFESILKIISFFRENQYLN